MSLGYRLCRFSRSFNKNELVCLPGQRLGEICQTLNMPVAVAAPGRRPSSPWCRTAERKGCPLASRSSRRPSSRT